MKFSTKRAVSPIIATLLLIAIAVAAGIIVYVYINSLSGTLTGGGGNQVSQQLQMQAYSFNAISGTGASSAGMVVDAFVKNVGSSSITIGSVYFDGTPLTEWSFASGTTYNEVLQVPGTGGNCFAAIPVSVTTVPVTLSASTSGSVSTSGTTALCGTNGAAQSCAAVVCIDTGATLGNHAETGLAASPLAAQSANQIVIGLNSAVTAGTSHTIKIVTTSGGQVVFTVVAGRSG